MSTDVIPMHMCRHHNQRKTRQGFHNTANIFYAKSCINQKCPFCSQQQITMRLLPMLILADGIGMIVDPLHSKPLLHFDCLLRNKYAKEPARMSRLFVLALPIFTARHQATIVGVCELNFCVRDGNRWTLTTSRPVTRQLSSAYVSLTSVFGMGTGGPSQQRPVTRQLSSAYVSLTSVFGMGTGGPSQQSIPTSLGRVVPSFIYQTLFCVRYLW